MKIDLRSQFKFGTIFQRFKALAKGVYPIDDYNLPPLYDAEQEKKFKKIKKLKRLNRNIKTNLAKQKN